jgi:hypothetical protein
MQRVMAVPVLLLVFFPSSCDSPVMEPEALTLPSQAQFSTQPIKEVSFSAYVPLIPGLYGTKTYLIEGGSITSQIVGAESVPYSPPITGIKMTLWEDSPLVFASFGKQMGLVKFGDYLFSRSCEAFPAYPQSMIIGDVYDGMILDMTGEETLWQVNASDPSDCIQMNTGDGDSYVFLIQVQDVRLPDRHMPDNWPDHQGEFKWHTYKDAIFMWELESTRDFELEYGGYAELLGIRFPTAEDTNGWAVDDVLIWGKNVGILLQGDVDLEEDGDFSVGMFLASQAPWPNR